LKIFYYDDNKINNNNKFYDKKYIQRKKIDIETACTFIHFKKYNNLFIKKIEINLNKNEISIKNMENIVKEFNSRIKCKYAFDIGLPKFLIQP
jgi:hypothetical protein